MSRRALSFLVVLGLFVLGACTESDLTLSSERRIDTDDPTEFDTTDTDDVIDAALDDLADYWSETLPAVYGESFEPPAGGLIAYGPSEGELFECGGVSVTYDEVAANALYCPDEDLIAWDRVELMPGLQEQFGPLTVGIVMAHEYGHAIQARGDVEGSTVALELQADCFAGAWVADVADRIDVFRIDGTALDEAIGGFLELRDTVGVDASDPNAHGSGFDRVSAFQDGFDSGADLCATYEDDLPTVVAIPFTESDLLTGGNLPIEQLLEPLLLDLESYFSALVVDQGGTWTPVPEIVAVDDTTDQVDCGSETYADDELDDLSLYCVADNSIYLDTEDLIPGLAEIGDFAVGGEISRLYAIAAQSQLGLLADAAEPGLHADCLNGTYAAAAFAETIVPTQELRLSAGDIDEIITAFLVFGGEESSDTAFERTAALRIGFLGDVGDCDRYL